MESSELLHFYLRGLRRLTGAESLALFIPAPPDADLQDLLIVEGDAPPLPEMESIESAQRFCNGLSEAPDYGAPPSVDSATPGGRLLALPRLPAAWSDLLRPRLADRGGSGAARRRHDLREPGLAERAWIGLRLGEENPRAERLLSEGGPWLIELAGRLAVHSDQVRRTLQDSVTGLPGRLGLQAILREELERAQGDRTAVSLLLLNPETFSRVNQQYGAEVGDAVLKELGDALVRRLRVTDAVSRFGGAIFAAVLPDTPTEGALVTARRLLATLGERTFTSDGVCLVFRIGVATAEPQARLGALDLIRRADQALNAAQLPGSERIRVWSSTGLEGATEEETAARILSTGDLGRDYRNMALLRDAIDIAAASSDVDGLVAEVLDRLAWALKPELTALLVRGSDGEVVLMRSVERDPQRGTLVAGPRRVAPEHLALAVECWESERTAPLSRATEDTLSWAVPVASAQGTLGVILIAGRPDALHIGPEDLIFVRALSSQLALALDRARLSHEQERQRREQSRVLRSHILDLERAIGRAHLLYRSATMENLAAEASRLAPTDGTVLLLGEPGTGKSLLARLLHAESPRAATGLTMVDCGALPPTLAEAELFGSEPGVYGAARHRDLGRLAEANLGTLYLADVGALPTSVQERLLQFLHDPYLTLPDATRQRLDVRIIASAFEVDGRLDPRLSEELGARLAMGQLRVSPLRERLEDVGVLAEHFLAEVGRQYRRSDLTLSAGALQALEAHRWPGNVRELQNRILQGALQCDGGVLEAADMGLQGDDPAAVFSTTAPRQQPRESLEECLDALAVALRDQLDEVARHQAAPLPLGRWLSDDLLLEAHAAVSEVARQGAARLGLAETTYRRRLEKAQEEVTSGLSVRTGDWHVVRKILSRLVRARGIEGEPLHALARRLLLRAILERYPNDERRAAGLFGVTVPTLRRRKVALSGLGA